MILASAYARGSLGGTLEIIDIDGQCAIWSYDNHGCTGSSEFFSQLYGDDCSNLRVKTGTPQGYPVSGVGACGTKKNSSVAWIEVEHTGLVSFFNYQGDKSACVLRFDDAEVFVISVGVILDYLPDRTFF
ncbi:hypothetical protein EN45_041390 [Penicillium chrysogenum]|uniref:Uncharacterized protein n=1 Tax=Penicillium chrysogenum TaxID=5076 RepID=A0A169XDA1_PENCH|nr:hypothetical protein EN45_034930 [Penicillium chrysogenum]KZN93951.1 hypothetical protein EN45_041390 [Penicillium chrysogenum]